MVAAAKLRRAQQAAVHARDYVRAVGEVAARLVANPMEEKHPLTVAKEKVVKKEFLVLTSDRGLCGGFNSNLLRKVEEELTKCREEGIRTESRIIGKKGRDYFKAKNLEVAEAVTGLYENLSRQVAKELARVAINRFESDKIDEVWIAYNFFKSTLVQEVLFKKLLPVDLPPAPLLIKEGVGGGDIDYIYEPSRSAVLSDLLKEWVASQIYSGLLESVASELAARMAAMDNATKNASEMIDYLTLVFNRARQASITKELMDIVNGAEALR